MSSGVNKCILVGRLGKDAEVRFVQSGNAVCTLRLATSERVKVGDDWQEKTEWHDVVTFGKTAENAGKYLKKGSQVYVEGRLQTRQYKDKENVDRYKTEVVCSQLIYLSANEGASKGGSGGKPNGKAADPADAGFVDDNLPF